MHTNPVAPVNLAFGGQRRETTDYTEKKKRGGGDRRVLDDLAAERAKLLEKESAELEDKAARFAREIEELDGAKP